MHAVRLQSGFIYLLSGLRKNGLQTEWISNGCMGTLLIKKSVSVSDAFDAQKMCSDLTLTGKTTLRVYESARAFFIQMIK